MKIKNTIVSSTNMLKMVLNKKCGKSYFFLRITRSVLSQLYNVAMMILPGLLLDYIVNLDSQNVLITGAFVTLTPFVYSILNSFLSRISYCSWMKIYASFQTEYYTRVSEIHYAYAEDPKYKDVMKKANEVLMNDFEGNIDNICALLSSVVSLLSIITITSIVNPLISGVCLLFVIIRSFSIKKNKEYSNRIYNEKHKFMMKYWFSTYNINEPLTRGELRLFDLGSFFTKLADSFLEKIHFYDKKRNLSNTKHGIINSIISTTQSIFVYSYLVFAIFAKKITIGMFSMSLSAINSFSNAIDSIVSSVLSFYDSKIHFDNYEQFINIPLGKDLSGSCIPIFNNDSVIEFKDVSFKYPNSDNYALKNLSFTIHGNEHIAIVGKNGSGKTTIIKLLLKFYQPSSGTILLNGKNIYDYDYRSYMNLFTAVLQDYARYRFSFYQSIVLNNEFDDVLFREVCLGSGLDGFYKKLPKGQDTQIGTELYDDGVVPSGGEWQRIAIARCWYNSKDIVLLDEPTASIDPDSESDQYNQFEQMSKNKCLVMITHRLSAVSLASRILVIDDGELKESGTHLELYKLNGVYRRMYEKQSSYYKKIVE